MSFITILPALIAAFIGSFSGALFTEYLGDLFFKRKRKRDIKASLAKELTKFDNYQTLHITVINHVLVIQHQQRLLQRIIPVLPDENREVFVKELIRITDWCNQEVEAQQRLFEKVSECEGEINALVFELLFYDSKNKEKSQSLLLELREERTARNVDVTGYENLEYDSLVEYRNMKFMEDVRNVLARKVLRLGDLKKRILEL